MITWPSLILYLAVSMLIASEIAPSVVQTYFAPSLPKFTFYDQQPLMPETETVYFAVFVSISAFLFSSFMGLASLSRSIIERTKWAAVESALLAGLCLGVICVGELPYEDNLAHSPAFYLIVVAAVAMLIPIRIRWPVLFHNALQILLIAALAKPLGLGFLEFDVGYFGNQAAIEPGLRLKSDLLWPHYFHLLWAVPIAVLFRRGLCRLFFSPDANRLVSIGALIATLAYLAFAILPAIQYFELSYDMFFTALPAYQIARGAVPFYDIVSQYGFLYLAPWVVALLLFSKIPITVQSMTILTMGFIVLFSMLLFLVLRKLQGNSALAAVAVVASLFYSTFNRVYFYPDKINIYSAPAFTPMRFGCFLLPLFFLVKYIKAPSERALSWYIYSCITICYFSADIGVGLSLAGLGAIVVTVFLTSPNWPASLRFVAFKIFSAISISLCIICFITLALRGALPDFSTYTLFIKLFSSGFCMVPLNGQMAIWVPLTFVCAGVCVGISLLRSGERMGSALIFLAFCQLVLLPYYLGRSYPPLLYSICTPSILIAALLLPLMAKKSGEDTIIKVAGSTLSSLIIFLAVLRTTLVAAQESRAAGYGAAAIANYVRTGLKDNPIIKSPPYEFLRQVVPADSRIIIFDTDEELLLTALHLKPALPYAFTFKFIVAKEQIDMAMKHLAGKQFYVFVNVYCAEHGYGQTVGVYKHIWGLLEPHAKLIKEDVAYKLYIVQFPDSNA